MTDQPAPGPKRIERALTTPMRVDKLAPGVYEVQSVGSDEVQRVDVEYGACLCEDFQYRSEEIGACKHLIRARAVHEARQLPAVESLPDFEDFEADAEVEYV